MRIAYLVFLNFRHFYKIDNAFTTPEIIASGFGVDAPATANAHIDSISIEEVNKLVHKTVFDSITQYLCGFAPSGYRGIGKPHTTVPHLHPGEVIFLLGIIKVETVAGGAYPRTGLAFDTVFRLNVKNAGFRTVFHNFPD